ncbi:MAG: amino acid ABC transporter permease [Candidatus Caldatribacteriota bacterium]|nr:amino acid ABC transporter permease [Candidatus Caldatribacteriota bacterium]
MNFFEFAWSISPKLLQGSLTSLELTALAISIGLILGIPLSLGRVYGNKIIYTLSTIYVEAFRGTPVLTQLFILYFGLPSIGIMFPPFTAAVIGLGLNSAAYQAEYFRGAIQAVKDGQMVAARSIGMSKIKAIRYIILPQMFRLVIPSWSNELILLLKASSIAYMIQVSELVSVGRQIASQNFRTFEVFLVIAFIYFVIVEILNRILHSIEGKIKIPGL